jgi:hypothetical protein
MVVNGSKMRTKSEYKLIRWILVLAGIFALPNSASAQGVSIQGHVTDPQGNVVIHAEVTLASSENKNVAVKEFRFALLHTFANGRMSLGMNLLIASGYAGQTTEVLALPGEFAPLERVVGVRLPSYVSLSYTYRFRSRQAP